MSSAVPLVPLGEIARISKGKKPKSLSLNAIDDTYLPYILIESFGSQYNQFTNDKTCRLVCESDIEIVWDGERAGLVSKGHKGYLGSTLASVSLTHESFDSEFIFYILQEKQNYLRQGAEGTGVPHLSRWVVENLSIYKLPLPEQKKIASILTSVDEVIENTQKQIDKLQDLKKATMNELLTKGIGHTDFKDSELGRIPRSWANISMDEALKCKILDSIQDGNHGGQHPKSSDYVIDGIPFVMASDLRNGKVDVSRAKKIPTDVYEGLRIGFAKVGDVLLTHKATIGEVAVVDEDCGDIMCTPQVTYYRIKDAERLSSRFLFYWFQSQPFQRELFRVSGQSTRDYIGIKAQKELFIRIPPVTEQNRITSILAAVDNKISKVEEKLTQTQSLKKSLMQDLLTGKVRVTVN